VQRRLADLGGEAYPTSPRRCARIARGSRAGPGVEVRKIERQ
jgi:hypothetical protein